MTTPSPEAQQAVLDAANRGCEIAAFDGRLVTMAKTNMALVGMDLARNVRPGERSWFCLPIIVDIHDGKTYPGAVLLLEHRVVVTWSEGLLRPKLISQAWDLSAIDNVRSFTRKVGRVSAQLATVAFTAGGREIELVTHSEISEKRAATMLEWALNGVMKASWDDERDEVAEPPTPAPQSDVLAAPAVGAKACRQPTCTGLGLPTTDNFCCQCGVPTAIA